MRIIWYKILTFFFLFPFQAKNPTSARGKVVNGDLLVVMSWHAIIGNTPVLRYNWILQISQNIFDLFRVYFKTFSIYFVCIFFFSIYSPLNAVIVIAAFHVRIIWHCIWSVMFKHVTIGAKYHHIFFISKNC